MNAEASGHADRTGTENHAVGEDKLSVVVTRKMTGDLVVCQHSLQRWFDTEEAAINALQQVMDVFLGAPQDGESESARDGAHATTGAAN